MVGFLLISIVVVLLIFTCLKAGGDADDRIGRE
jgi:hypothetical protein